MRKYKHLICGYYGMQNTGDDALLHACLTHLDVPESQIAVTARHTQQGTAILPPKQRFRGHDRLCLYRAAAQADSLVFGGGSTLHSYTDIQIKNHMFTLAGDGPHVALGLGVGPFRDHAAHQAARRLLHKLDFIGVRDEASYDLCRSMGLGSRLEKTADLVPSLLHDKTLRQRVHTGGTRSGIGVSLCPVESINGGNTVEETQRTLEICRALEQVYRITGELIYLIDLNGNEALGDQYLHSSILRALPAHIPVTRIPYDPNPLRCLQNISRLKCVLAMRLHAQIFAFLTNTPVIAINYHSKNRGWADLTKAHPSLSINLDDVTSTRLVKTLLAGLKSDFPVPATPLDKVIRASSNNWRYLNEG